MFETILSLVTSFFTQYPAFASVLMVMGACRVVMKPAFTLFHAIAEITPTKKDDAILEEVESSKVYKAVVFALDYFASVKLQK
jgi:hypothetical protein